MNRRVFLVSVAALAVAPAVKAERVLKIKSRRLCPYPRFKGIECGAAPTEIRLTEAEAERIFKLAAKGNFASLKTLSYGQGGIVPKIS